MYFHKSSYYLLKIKLRWNTQYQTYNKKDNNKHYLLDINMILILF